MRGARCKDESAFLLQESSHFHRSLPLAWLLKENNSKYKVLAIDINERSLQRLEERAERIQVKLETLEP